MRVISCLFAVLSCMFLAPRASAEPSVDLFFAVVVDRVEATFVFSEPVDRVELPFGAPGGPEADVRVEGSNVVLDGSELRGPRPFGEVTLSLGQDRRDRDSVYPLATRLEGQGYVVYAPHLIPEGVTTRVTLPGQVHPLGEAAADGYLLVGGALQDYGAVKMAASTQTPEVLATEAADRAKSLVAFYAGRMERAPAWTPVILLAYSDAQSGSDPGRFRGDVSSNGVVFLRVRASAQSGEAGSLDRYTSFLAHEIFHLWNASRNPDRGEWWLHEGAAEYASWTAMATLWPASRPALEERLTTALRACSINLGEKPLNALSDPESRAVRYACGAVMNWLADLGVRAGGEGDFFSISRELAAVREREGLYTATSFLTALESAEPSALTAVRGLMEERGINRWEDVARTANGLGAEAVVGPPAGFPLRVNASRALVLAACDEVHGVGDGQAGLFVQAPSGCEAFGEMTFIVSADGLDPALDPVAYFQAIQSKCAARGRVEVVVRNEDIAATKSVHCDVAVDPAPVDIQLLRLEPAGKAPIHSHDQSTLIL
jgi:hypothetical protein